MQDTDSKIEMAPHFMMNHFLLFQLLYCNFHEWEVKVQETDDEVKSFLVVWYSPRTSQFHAFSQDKHQRLANALVQMVLLRVDLGWLQQ